MQHHRENLSEGYLLQPIKQTKNDDKLCREN